MSIEKTSEAHHEFLFSSLLSTLHSPSAPSASCIFSLPFFPPCPAMPLSWLRVLVYDWVTLLCLWSFLSLSIFSYLPALPSIYLSTLSIWVYHQIFCVCLVLWCLIACYYFTFLISPLLTRRSPCLSASCYCNHLFTQPVAHFLPSPVSYSLILSDFITLMQEKALLFSLPTIATNSDRVFLFVSELWCVQCTCVCVCTCEPTLHKLQKKKNQNKTLCFSICYAFLTLTYTHTKYSLLNPQDASITNI